MTTTHVEVSSLNTIGDLRMLISRTLFDGLGTVDWGQFYDLISHIRGHIRLDSYVRVDSKWVYFVKII
ncbi:hypothetical protein CLOP_g7887 [Closterium sp. NIES-67]|nr:hypothetical protein CLOP_g7887 [Closterium sp. NIES-67]